MIKNIKYGVSVEEYVDEEKQMEENLNINYIKKNYEIISRKRPTTSGE